jgi:hypothetical protein
MGTRFWRVGEKIGRSSTSLKILLLNSYLKICISSQRTDRLWAPPGILYSGHQGYFLGDKTAGREANHSPKNAWCVPPDLQYLHGVVHSYAPRITLSYLYIDVRNVSEACFSHLLNVEVTKADIM